MEVTHGGQHVVLDPIKPGLGLRPARLPIPAKIDGHNAKSRLRQFQRLLLPTLLVKPASVRQHNASFSFSVDVGVDDTSILSRKRNVFLGHSRPSHKQSRKDRPQDKHREIVYPLSTCLLSAPFVP